VVPVCYSRVRNRLAREPSESQVPK